MRRRLIFSITVLSALFLFASYSLSAEFWGSKNSNKYHNPSCSAAQKIKPSNLVKFGSPEDATKAGYVPCKICKPPTATKSENSPNIILASSSAAEPNERSGCCSWHGGVCGCDETSGRQICCDGTLSPSCR